MREVEELKTEVARLRRKVEKGKKRSADDVDIDNIGNDRDKRRRIHEGRPMLDEAPWKLWREISKDMALLDHEISHLRPAVHRVLTPMVDVLVAGRESLVERLFPCFEQMRNHQDPDEQLRIFNEFRDKEILATREALKAHFGTIEKAIKDTVAPARRHCDELRKRVSHARREREQVRNV